MIVVPDLLFSLPRLAEVYDALDPDRGDLEVYAALLAELGAQSVMDVGCGTGTLAVMLAAQGLEVVGVDPAQASLGVAVRKPDADRASWVCADATALPPVAVDAVTMTGNVAQVFVDDEDWATALQAAWRVLSPGGHLVFEIRNPDAQAWRTWTREASYRKAVISDGVVENWFEVTDVAPSFGEPEIREAPDRPGLEHVFIARKPP